MSLSRDRSMVAGWPAVGAGGRVSRSMLSTGLLALTMSALVASTASGQVLGGVVVEEGTGRPIAGAVLHLLNEEGDGLAVALADSLGRYLLQVDGPGSYRIATEAYGYVPFLSHLLAVGQGEYSIDVELARAPFGLPGLEVAADRYAELERGLRLVIGLHPRSLRYAPILRPTIDEHLAKGRGLPGLVRWSNLPSIIVKNAIDSPCFQWRTRHCLPVYLNGAPLSPEFVAFFPLDLVDMIVIMSPNESVVYAAGGVLLYTAGWVR